MATYQRGKYWWYRFRFAGERIDEPTKSTSRTVAKDAERQHRKTLEAGYNNFKEVRQNRVRILEEIMDEYLTGYRLRYRSATFAEYALGHVSRLLGTKIVADITEISVLRYQEDRLREKAAPKSINEEVRFLLKMLGDPGEVIRAHLKKTRQLKLTVHKNIGKAFDGEETESLASNAKSSRSPHMYPAFMLARNGGLRDTEIKTLTWGQLNFIGKTVQVGRAKSEAGEGRIVPLNSDVYYGAPPGWIGRKVNVQWDAMFVRLLDPRTGALLREHLSGKRGGHRIRDADRPRRTPPPLLQLLARAHKAGASIGAVCDAIHARQGELGMRRIQGVLQLVKQYGSVAADDACAAAMELRVPEYRFVRRYLERRPKAPLTLRQVDPLIRELSQYRDLIQQRINFEEPNP